MPQVAASNELFYLLYLCDQWLLTFSYPPFTRLYCCLLAILFQNAIMLSSCSNLFALNMNTHNLCWMSLDEGAIYFGYEHPESFRRRLRQLRKLGHVTDIGKPPSKYPTSDQVSKDKIVLLWPNPKTALIHCQSPTKLLDPKRGKRAKEYWFMAMFLQDFAIPGEPIAWKYNSGTFSKAGMLAFFPSLSCATVCNPGATA